VHASACRTNPNASRIARLERCESVVAQVCAGHVSSPTLPTARISQYETSKPLCDRLAYPRLAVPSSWQVVTASVTGVDLRHALSQRGDRVAWSVKVTEEYAAWFTALIKEDLASAVQVAQAVAALREEGPALGRPLVDRIQGSKIHHLKELRPGSAGRSEIRVLFAFDPTRSALLLLGGDKAGNWQRWYRQNILVAEQLYLEYTTEQEE
jgi:hypothetical protein